MSVKTRRGIREIRTKEWIATVVATIGALVNGAFIMLVGSSSLFEALGVPGYVAIFSVLGITFPVVFTRFGYTISLSAIFVSTHSRFMGSLTSTLVTVFGLASGATLVAFFYVGAFWLLLGVFVLPLALGTTFPNLAPSFFIGCSIFALSLGGFYGITIQEFLKG